MGEQKYLEALKTVSPARYIELSKSNYKLLRTYLLFWDPNVDSRVLGALARAGHPMAFFRNDVVVNSTSFNLLELLEVALKYGVEIFEESIWPQMRYEGSARISYERDNMNGDTFILEIVPEQIEKPSEKSKFEWFSHHAYDESRTWVTIDESQVDLNFAIDLVPYCVPDFETIAGDDRYWEDEDISIERLTGCALLGALARNYPDRSLLRSESISLNPSGEMLAISTARDFVDGLEHRPVFVSSDYPHKKSLIDWAGIRPKSRSIIIKQLIKNINDPDYDYYIESILQVLKFNSLTTADEISAISNALH